MRRYIRPHDGIDIDSINWGIQNLDGDLLSMQAVRQLYYDVRDILKSIADIPVTDSKPIHQGYELHCERPVQCTGYREGDSTFKVIAHEEGSKITVYIIKIGREPVLLTIGLCCIGNGLLGLINLAVNYFKYTDRDKLVSINGTNVYYHGRVKPTIHCIHLLDQFKIGLTPDMRWDDNAFLDMNGA